MKRWLQRLHGAIGTALTWAIGWCAAGLITGTTGLLGQLALADYALFGGIFAILGFVSGAVFSVAVALIEGHRRFDQMSLPRFAAWGGLGGALMSLAMFAIGDGENVGFVSTVGFFMVLGASSATGSLLLARRGEDRELLQSAEEVAEVGLTPEAAGDLLGK